jgi:ABC-2 type transport system ATP-binding protein
MPSAIEFQGVSKEYRSFFGRRRFNALHEFTLQVETGEIFGFLGPNGAGKTTAIHLAMGFMRPTQGSGRLLGHPFGHVATRRSVGFLPENVALYPRRADELIYFYGGLSGMTRSQLRTRAHDVLETVGLHEDSNRNVSKFSRGMLQRAGLAQAMVNDPKLLILDEPTSALDPLSRVNVRELLLRAREQGKTIFLSSHLLSEVELICDRVAILHHGKLVRLGRITDLLGSGERSQIVARGIDANSFPGATTRDGVVMFSVSSAQQRNAIERVWALSGEVVSVTPERRSLEEMFLELTSPQTRPGGSP